MQVLVKSRAQPFGDCHSTILIRSYNQAELITTQMARLYICWIIMTDYIAWSLWEWSMTESGVVFNYLPYIVDHLIAALVAQLIVNGFELINIYENYRYRNSTTM